MPRPAMPTLLLVLVMCGCTVTDGDSRTVARPSVPVEPTSNGKIVRLDLAVIEQPIGDLYINKQLWEQTDNSILGWEKQAVLDENGFRVGQIVGSPPEQLWSLLMSERSCPKPRRRVVPSGSVILQELSPVRPHGDFRVFENDSTTQVSFDDVECVLDLQAASLEDGGTRVRFTPKVQFGKAGPLYKSSERGWTMELGKPARAFPGASWEVTLHVNDLLVIGALLDRQDTLGFQAFVDQGLTPKQRLLVIRAHGKTDSELVPVAENSLPLAQQAAMSTVRASQH